jgi:hypothetical protein
MEATNYELSYLLNKKLVILVIVAHPLCECIHFHDCQTEKLHNLVAETHHFILFLC